MLYLRFVLFSFLLSTATTNMVYALEFRLANRFFDYGNGAINLDNVTHITPEISAIITLASDNQDAFLKEYSSNATKQVIEENYLGWLDVSVNDSEPYYYYEFDGKVLFDLFTLQIFDTFRFLKLPQNEQELANVGNKAKFKAFLDRLELHLIQKELLVYSDDVLSNFGNAYFQLASGSLIAPLSAAELKGRKADVRQIHEVYEIVTKY